MKNAEMVAVFRERAVAEVDALIGFYDEWIADLEADKKILEDKLKSLREKILVLQARLDNPTVPHDNC